MSMATVSSSWFASEYVGDVRVAWGKHVLSEGGDALRELGVSQGVAHQASNLGQKIGDQLFPFLYTMADGKQWAY